jgi:sugar/nucleoside kinase (ribokinase family)
MVAGNLIVTHGEKGAFYITDGTLYHVAVPDVNAVDTVGAGDNFHAAFALALSRDFDLHQAVKLSVAVASLSCREYGGREGVPSWEQALEIADTLREKIVASIS